MLRYQFSCISSSNLHISHWDVYLKGSNLVAFMSLVNFFIYSASFLSDYIQMLSRWSMHFPCLSSSLISLKSLFATFLKLVLFFFSSFLCFQFIFGLFHFCFLQFQIFLFSLLRSHIFLVTHSKSFYIRVEKININN